MGGEELKWHQLPHHQLMSLPRTLILIHTVQLKQMIKAQILGRMVSSGISDVASASVHSEKTRPKKLMKMIIIIIIVKNKWQEMTVFSGRQKLTFVMKLRLEK